MFINKILRINAGKIFIMQALPCLLSKKLNIRM